MMNESTISIDHSRMKQIFPMQTFDPNFVAIQINHLESTNIPRASGSIASANSIYVYNWKLDVPSKKQNRYSIPSGIPAAV